MPYSDKLRGADKYNLSSAWLRLISRRRSYMSESQ